MIFFLLILPTILFYLILKMKRLYKIILSIVFYILFFIVVELLKNLISNIHYYLTDKIGYNHITDFTRNFSNISDILFVIIITLIMLILYKKSKH